MGQRLAKAATAEEQSRKSAPSSDAKAKSELELKEIVKDIREVLDRIEDAVPLINLAITTSGANLSTALPSTISPSRLLQASTFLTAGDSQYATLQSPSVQIGPTFTLSLYMLFQGHLRPQDEEDVRSTTWQEVIHKARLKLLRVSLDKLYDSPGASENDNADTNSANGSTRNLPSEVRSDEYAYKLVLLEDLDDDRVHTFEEGDPQPSPCLDVEQAGIREAVPVHEISKIFYADTGKILNIGSDGEINNPILLLKRDPQAVPPRRMMIQRLNDSEDQDHILESVEQPSSPLAGDNSQDKLQTQIDSQLDRVDRGHSIDVDNAQQNQQWRIPSNIDPEWLAFEVYAESEDSDTESNNAYPDAPKPSTSRAHSLDPGLTSALSNLRLNGSSSPNPNPIPSQYQQQLIPTTSSKHSGPVVRTSLSLLETLLRLLSLQQFQQASHLSIPDELLNFFLSEAATTGAATGDDVTRRRLRHEARQRVGFDPYDESPIKRRGEEYQYRGGTSQAGGDFDDNVGGGGWDTGGEQYYNHHQYHEGWTPEHEQQGQEAYTSLQDEGYATYEYRSSEPRVHRSYQRATPSSLPSSSSPRLQQQQQFLTNRKHSSSRQSTPDGQLPPFPRSASSDDKARKLSLPGSPGTPPSLQGRFKSYQHAAGRKGSPLGRAESKQGEERPESTAVRAVEKERKEG